MVNNLKKATVEKRKKCLDNLYKKVYKRRKQFMMETGGENKLHVFQSLKLKL